VTAPTTGPAGPHLRVGRWDARFLGRRFYRAEAARWRRASRHRGGRVRQKRRGAVALLIEARAAAEPPRADRGGETAVARVGTKRPAATGEVGD